MKYFFFLLLVLFPALSFADMSTQAYDGREIELFTPSHLPPKGERALVIVLHGGLGNANRIVSGQIEHGLNLNEVAEKAGFMVAYLNGTPVTTFLGKDKLGWNAGGECCGVPAKNNIDDVGYISSAVDHLEKQYGISPKKVFGIGHSNGAIMVQRMLCETNTLAAGVAISGPLNLDIDTCPHAKGHRVLALHGEHDENVPVGGGVGSKGISHINFKSEDYAKQLFTSSGGTYEIDLVDADHFLKHIEDALQKSENQTVQEKAARFFGLMK